MRGAKNYHVRKHNQRRENEQQQQQQQQQQQHEYYEYEKTNTNKGGGGENKNWSNAYEKFHGKEASDLTEEEAKELLVKDETVHGARGRGAAEIVRGVGFDFRQ